jgi:MFS family permease
MMKPAKDDVQEHKALLAMSWLGLGSIFGSISTGQFLDRVKNPHKPIILLNLLYLTIAMSLLIYFTLRNEWSLLLASLLSFFMGLQDGALNTVLFVYLGF